MIRSEVRRFVPEKPGVYWRGGYVVRFVCAPGGYLQFDVQPAEVVDRLNAAASPCVAKTLFFDGFELADAIEAAAMV